MRLPSSRTDTVPLVVAKSGPLPPQSFITIFISEGGVSRTASSAGVIEVILGKTVS